MLVFRTCKIVICSRSQFTCQLRSNWVEIWEQFLAAEIRVSLMTTTTACNPGKVWLQKTTDSHSWPWISQIAALRRSHVSHGAASATARASSSVLLRLFNCHLWFANLKLRSLECPALMYLHSCVVLDIVHALEYAIYQIIACQICLVLQRSCSLMQTFRSRRGLGWRSTCAVTRATRSTPAMAAPWYVLLPFNFSTWWPFHHGTLIMFLIS